jgi:uncharacterized protein YjbI with pentapeptide repeats
MAIQDHVDRLKQGMESWNKWRRRAPTVDLETGRPVRFSFVDLTDANLSGANLRGFDFIQTFFSGANLSKSELSHANFSQADLHGTDLSGANLSSANFTEAILEGADLSGANLNSANLSKARLNGANLSEARLDGANLSEARLGETSYITSDRREGKISGANLSGANLSGANFSRASLSGAYLSKFNLSGLDFSGAYLNGANLSGANLSGANLSGATLIGADLSSTDLTGTNLSGTDLSQTKLSGANLTRADLSGATLEESSLRETILRETNLSGHNLNNVDLSGIDLSGANLNETSLIKTNFSHANLSNCSIYGIAAWDIQLDEQTVQKNLIITPPDQPVITVDNLKVAQFIYLLLSNKEIREVIDTITSKVVLILGRFTPERKAILDALREALRARNYSPIVFDFEIPGSRDITETVSLLARMARFVIADLTDAKSIPQELSVIVPDLPSVPVQPLLQTTDKAYSMFEHWMRYSSVLNIYYYTSVADLLPALKEHIIDPAEQKVQELRRPQ